MNHLLTFLSAALFGLGLGISGMTNPENIIGFLDITGHWKPALMLVMVGAIGVHGISYYFIVKRASPLFGEKFLIPEKRSPDGKLVVGSVIFGVGWGLGGYCPGPAVASLLSFQSSVVTFIASMIAGMLLYHILTKQNIKG